MVDFKEIIDEIEKSKNNGDEFSVISDENAVKRKMSHSFNFCILLQWLSRTSENQEFFYLDSLRKFLKVSHQRVWQIASELDDLGLIYKKPTGKFLSCFFIKNSHTPLVQKYKDLAIKLTGVKIYE